jgi:hypothetical protein
VGKLIINGAGTKVLFDDGTYKEIVLTTKYATTLTPVKNSPQTVNHQLNSTDVVVNVYDATTKNAVIVDVTVVDNNNITITSTTTDSLRIVVEK